MLINTYFCLCVCVMYKGKLSLWLRPIHQSHKARAAQTVEVVRAFGRDLSSL